MTKRIRVYVVWGVLAVLVGGIYVLQSRERPAYIAPEDQRHMFAFQEPDVGQVDLLFRGRAASLMRSSGGLWFLHDASHQHNPNPAGVNGSPMAAAGVAGGATDPAQTAAGQATPSAADGPGADEPHPEPDAQQAAKLAVAVDFLARMIFDRRIDPTQRLEEYGLDIPQIIIIFYPRNADNSAGQAPISMLFVGSTLSHNQSYYAQASGDRDIALIPLYQVNMLTQLAVGEIAQAPARPLGLNPTNR